MTKLTYYQLHASQIRQQAQHPTYPLHKLTIHPHTPRLKKQTTFNNINYTTNIDTHPNTVSQQTQHKYTPAWYRHTSYNNATITNSYINTPLRSLLPNSPSLEKHVAPSPNLEPIKVPS